VLHKHGGGSRFRALSALRFAAPASLMAASDQLLVNGAPLLVVLGTGHAGKTAGVVFAATMLVRAPVYVFQGLAASLLPNFTVLNAAERERFRAAVHRTALVLFGVGVCIVLGTAAFGPEAMRLLYGNAYGVDRGSLVLLGAGVACYWRRPRSHRGCWLFIGPAWPQPPGAARREPSSCSTRCCPALSSAGSA
jgi:O-antigen/teichoic acid export membrane protein